MDFIERIFHFSPDHGNGVFEAGLLAGLVLVPLMLKALRSLRGRTFDRR